jgi:hypothetical protein
MVSILVILICSLLKVQAATSYASMDKFDRAPNDRTTLSTASHTAASTEVPERVNWSRLFLISKNTVGFIGVLLAGGGSLTIAVSTALPSDSAAKTPLSITGAVLAGTGAICSSLEMYLKKLIIEAKETKINDLEGRVEALGSRAQSQ